MNNWTVDDRAMSYWAMSNRTTNNRPADKWSMYNCSADMWSRPSGGFPGRPVLVPRAQGQGRHGERKYRRDS